MNKQIPIYFDTIILDTPVQELSMSNGSDVGSRLNVAVFTKYRNRNGSYITDEYADYLIKSATQGDTPVVGFFDPETKSWASHTGPTLANGYGYVEAFLGWQPLTDTDGVSREYAVFSVVLFTKYYEEANKIRGQYQSMELNPETIEGDWANFDGEEYFVYTKGDMLGLCVIGSHEPCFSVSSFFSKNDETYKSQYEKFSLLLSDLKTRVKEAEIIIKGGEQPVENFELNENETVVENTENEVVDTEVEIETETETETESAIENFSADNEEAEVEVETEANVEEVESESEVKTDTEFELLQQKYDELNNSFNNIQEQFNAASTTINELNASIEQLNTQIQTLTSENEGLRTSLASYEVQAQEIEKNKKEDLIKKYEKILNSEEIDSFRAKMNDITYDELESKLAITFANIKLAEDIDKKVLIPENKPESQFALLMKKYKK